MSEESEPQIQLMEETLPSESQILEETPQPAPEEEIAPVDEPAQPEVPSEPEAPIIEPEVPPPEPEAPTEVPTEATEVPSFAAPTASEVVSKVLSVNVVSTDSRNNNLPPRIKCCLEKGNYTPLSFTQNVKAIYDVLSGTEAFPCNECDRPLCKESLFQWLSSIVIDVVDALKTVIPDTTNSGCGTMDVETLQTNTKGTFADMDDLSLANTEKRKSEPKQSDPYDTEYVEEIPEVEIAAPEGLPGDASMQIELVGVETPSGSRVKSIIELYEAKTKDA